MGRERLIIVDDLLGNPMQARNYALGLDYQVMGYECGREFPGIRAQMGPEQQAEWDPMLRKVLGEIIGTDLTAPAPRFETLQFYFQIAWSEHRSWVHVDTVDWAGVLALTPDAPPSAGTGIFRHIPNVPGRPVPPLAQLLWAGGC
jgi:hypothetical protein